VPTFEFLEFGAAVGAVKQTQWRDSMIKQVVEIYIRLLKVAAYIALGAGLTVASIKRQSELGKRALTGGLVKIPAIRD
jgi:Na+/H+-dicarboxylate symporter